MNNFIFSLIWLSLVVKKPILNRKTKGPKENVWKKEEEKKHAKPNKN